MLRLKEYSKWWPVLVAIGCMLVLIGAISVAQLQTGDGAKIVLENMPSLAPTGTSTRPAQQEESTFVGAITGVRASVTSTAQASVIADHPEQETAHAQQTPLPDGELDWSSLVAPSQGPSASDKDIEGARYYTETGHYVSGDFLSFYDSIPNAVDLFGLPLTEEFIQPLPGATLQVQYFERARLERDPTTASGVQVGAVVPALLKGRSIASLPATTTSSSNRPYFPQTGHTITGGFLEFWQANGGIQMFGYPLSEEFQEDGLTVQYFERARMEYYPEFAGTPYAVQLSPVGYLALKADLTGNSAATTPVTLVRFNPPQVAEGHTTKITVDASAGMTVTGTYEGRPLFFQPDPARGVAWSLIGTVPFQDTGPHQVLLTVEDARGEKYAAVRNLVVSAYPYSSESLQFDPETAKLLASDTVAQEQALLDRVFSGRTPQRYWTGAFRMPLDGQILVTSRFGTRRCYNCPDGSEPTTYHSGIDLAASVGTPVHASASGIVVFAGTLLDRGDTLVIDHGLGVYTLYAHNSRLIAEVGQHIEKGDIISLSGSTGLSTGPHLHWELHVSGPAVDPTEWVRRDLP